MRDNGAMISGRCHVDSELRAEAEFFLAVLPQRHEAEELFDPVGFMRLLRLLRVYDVGRNPDGSSLTMPEHLLMAESAALKS